MHRILIVDDERSVHDVLRAYLEHNGFEVVSAFSGREAISLAQQRDPSLVVLDLGLPDIPGEEVCAALRRNGDVGIIMLTARTTEDERVMGLEIGADDFMHKPYSPRELVSRVKAVLRRTSPAGAGGGQMTFENGRLVIDPVRHEVRLDGVALPLTPAEYKLLAALGSHPGAAFSRLQLVEHITGDHYAGYERTIDAHVKNLRRKLGENPSSGEWIETVRGVGYRLGVPKK